MANTIEFARIYSQKMDEQLVAEAVSGFLEDNAAGYKYSGGNTISIPKLAFQSGLADYDRTGGAGYVRGDMTFAFEQKTFAKYRTRTFTLDANSVDETNFVLSAAKVAAEFQRSQVVPEIDAYRFSKIFASAPPANIADYSLNKATIGPAIKADILAVQDLTGLDTSELVILASYAAMGTLEISPDLLRTISVQNFKQGGVETSIKSIDGIPIIRVPSARFKSAYVFRDGKTAGQTAGGFTPDEDAQDINWIIMPKRAALAISKTDAVTIIPPDSNPNFYGYSINFVKYHDCWVLDNSAAAIFIKTQPMPGE
jgi:hypothetical protein